MSLVQVDDDVRQKDSETRVTGPMTVTTTR